ncbi:MAG TPA: FG-GAP-like repeat-containing protein, partial [Ignavibacteria bacterium]|nr:FG-GAP-like repeat-containing protein [Ignavibacteria bacterium]HMR41555.1 FG-GAP-like repeat-containing protein [Ignavibacteria bacterium]
MKVLILSFIIISTTIQAQSILYPEFQNQIEYYKSNGFDDENGNTIFNNSELSSIIFTSDTIKSAFGISVSSAGDVNGDGFSDIIVGASSYNSGTGRAYIFFGGLTMDNIADVTLIGNNILQCAFGSSVSTAGDVNGDGFSDVIVGAGNYVSNTGKAYIYYGGSPMDSIYDKTMTGESIQNHFGSSVSSAGDVNGDGFSDVIVGAFRYNNYTGKAYIYFGGSPMNGVVDITLTGNTTGGYLGYSVSNAGDVNGDGFSDVII